MKVLAIGAVAAASLLSISALGACEQPSMAAIPDGATATEVEMLTAQTNVKSYLAEMELYLVCLNEDLETAGEDAPAEFKSLMATRHSSAMAEMDAVAAAFNQQVQAYRTAHPVPERSTAQ